MKNLFKKGISIGDFVIVTKQYEELYKENLHEIFNGDECEVKEIDSVNNAALLRLCDASNSNEQAWFKFGAFVRA